MFNRSGWAFLLGTWPGKNQSSMLSDKQINELSRRQINAIFRGRDDSNLWPICGRFNVTERAIRRVRRLYGCELSGLEYYLTLENTISEIVNDPAL